MDWLASSWHNGERPVCPGFCPRLFNEQFGLIDSRTGTRALVKRGTLYS
jgi:hypothetical protein